MEFPGLIGVGLYRLGEWLRTAPLAALTAEVEARFSFPRFDTCLAAADLEKMNADRPPPFFQGRRNVPARPNFLCHSRMSESFRRPNFGCTGAEYCNERRI